VSPKLYGFISNCGLNKINIASMTSPANYIHRRRVEFADTDAAGVAHFSRLLAMVEEAEHGFFRERGIPILTSDSAWPVVRVEVDFAAACRFGDGIEMRLLDFQPGKTSLVYCFEALVEGRRVFSGKMTKCHISPKDQKSAPIPDEIRKLFPCAENLSNPGNNT
jgi:acyl-CoA thioester hydrolase